MNPICSDIIALSRQLSIDSIVSKHQQKEQAMTDLDERDGKFHGDPLNGMRAEAYFALLAEERGYTVRESSVEEDRTSHIDLYITLDGETRSVDVKSKRNVGRRSGNEYTWVEFVNVSGRRGSLYGKADFIAFERDRDFLIVERKAFTDWAGSVVKISDTVGKDGDALYKAYCRAGDKSVCSIIRFADIPSNIRKKYWKKDLTD